MAEKVSLITSLREFLVDILGALIPGILFLGSVFLLLVFPIWIFFFNLQEAEIISPGAYGSLISFFKYSRVEFIIFCLLASYAIGRIFFRLDQKIPDSASFKRISKDKNRMNLLKPWVVISEEKEKNILKNNSDQKLGVGEDRVHYPYYNLYEYLESKGLLHLCKPISWRGELPETYKKRTKNTINILKERLAFHFPSRFNHISRNEGHIRLMSSLWYVMNSFIRIGILSLALNLLIIYYFLECAKCNWGQIYIISIAPMFVSLSFIVLAILTKIRIETFFHFMRVREVVQILDAAFTAPKKVSEILDN